MEPKGTFPYRLAQLSSNGGDPSKRWRITYYVWDVSRSDLVRRQKWIPAKFETKAQKTAEAKRLIKGINKLLVDGYHIGNRESAKVNKTKIVTVDQAFNWVFDQKALSVRDSTRDKYELILKDTKLWIETNQLKGLPIHSITQQNCEDLMLWMRKERDLENNSYNTYLSLFKSYFNSLVDSDLLAKSPAKNLKPLRVDESEDVYFSAEVCQALLEQYPERVKVMAKYVYYTCARHGELIQLKVKHVRENSIFIPGHISKNRKARHILISPALNRLLDLLKVRDMPPEYFLVSKNGIPGTKKSSRNVFSQHHLRIRIELGLPENFTFYCWKHTGASDTYKKTKDVVFVSKQCGHSNLDMTMTYLRGMGLMMEYSQAENLPDLGI